ncbi:hypothetical protein EG329_007329 [Mollisiaceae sp. DMI_Dod_QoI]|nr:hypothetical protein EG329_007329 [Helotiales sp. DMI_Dod_QoI]
MASDDESEQSDHDERRPSTTSTAWSHESSENEGPGVTSPTSTDNDSSSLPRSNQGERDGARAPGFWGSLRTNRNDDPLNEDRQMTGEDWTDARRDGDTSARAPIRGSSVGSANGSSYSAFQTQAQRFDPTQRHVFAASAENEGESTEDQRPNKPDSYSPRSRRSPPDSPQNSPPPEGSESSAESVGDRGGLSSRGRNDGGERRSRASPDAGDDDGSGSAPVASVAGDVDSEGFESENEADVGSERSGSDGGRGLHRFFSQQIIFDRNQLSDRPRVKLRARGSENFWDRGPDSSSTARYSQRTWRGGYGIGQLDGSDSRSPSPQGRSESEGSPSQGTPSATRNPQNTSTTSRPNATPTPPGRDQQAHPAQEDMHDDRRFEQRFVTNGNLPTRNVSAGRNRRADARFDSAGRLSIGDDDVPMQDVFQASDPIGQETHPAGNMNRPHRPPNIVVPGQDADSSQGPGRSTQGDQSPSSSSENQAPQDTSPSRRSNGFAEYTIFPNGRISLYHDTVPPPLRPAQGSGPPIHDVFRRGFQDPAESALTPLGSDDTVENTTRRLHNITASNSPISQEALQFESSRATQWRSGHLNGDRRTSGSRVEQLRGMAYAERRPSITLDTQPGVSMNSSLDQGSQENRRRSSSEAFSPSSNMPPHRDPPNLRRQSGSEQERSDSQRLQERDATRRRESQELLERLGEGNTFGRLPTDPPDNTWRNAPPRPSESRSLRAVWYSQPRETQLPAQNGSQQPPQSEPRGSSSPSIQNGRPEPQDYRSSPRGRIPDSPGGVDPTARDRDRGRRDSMTDNVDTEERSSSSSSTGGGRQGSRSPRRRMNEDEDEM